MDIRYRLKNPGTLEKIIQDLQVAMTKGSLAGLYFMDNDDKKPTAFGHVTALDLPITDGRTTPKGHPKANDW